MSTLWTIFEYAWLIGLAASFAAGLLAVVSPRLFVKLNRVANTWVNIPYFNSGLSGQVSIDRAMYRFHVVVGMLLVLGALLMFHHLFFRIHGGPGLSLPRSHADETFWFNLTQDVVVTGVCLAAVTGLLAGVMMLTAPAFLKSLDSWSNRWVSTQGVIDYIERSVFNLDQWGEKHTRAYGALVLSLATLIAAIAFLPFWFKA
jgi:hypothetical protein